MAKKARAKSGSLRLYKSYMFKEKDPVIDVMRTAVQTSHADIKDIPKNGGPSDATVRNWFFGVTKRPQFATCQAAMRAIGKDFVLMDYDNPKKKR